MIKFGKGLNNSAVSDVEQIRHVTLTVHKFIQDCGQYKRSVPTMHQVDTVANNNYRYDNAKTGSRWKTRENRVSGITPDWLRNQRF